MLTLLASHLQQIRQHAESTYPEECCGLLLGTLKRDRAILAVVHPTVNSWSSQSENFGQNPGEQGLSKRNRFEIAPETLLSVQKMAREQGLDVIGVYHSHPDEEAKPSAFDQAIAWPAYFYIIVSVHQGQAQDILCWQLPEQGDLIR